MIRLATKADFPVILKIYESAREFMRSQGNPNQWLNDRPKVELLENDIENRRLYVLDDNGIYAVFACIIGRDPTYDVIEGGSWLSDSLYATIHRIASDGTHAGVFHECSDFVYAITGHVRIDTHQDNKPMQQAILREGYSYRGIIYVDAPVTPQRLAYEKI